MSLRERVSMGIALHIAVNLVFAVMVLFASLGTSSDGNSLLVASDPSPGPIVASPQMHGRGMTELAAGLDTPGVGPAALAATSATVATAATQPAESSTSLASSTVPSTTASSTTSAKPTTTTAKPPATTTQPPAATIPGVGDGPPATPQDRFDRLAYCESTLNPKAISPGGRYRGAFQFSMPTWRSAGGTGDPIEHSYAHQKAIAQYWATQADPFTQWPVCWPRTL